MSVALDVEQAVAGFVNTRPDGTEFDLPQVNEYIMSLWNAGCGPVRLNFTQAQLDEFLKSCCKICLAVKGSHPRYVIEKSRLDFTPTKEESRALGNDPEKIRSFALFCKLHVSLRTPDRLLEAMGFRFMYRD